MTDRHDSPHEHEGPVIRDKRRIDPQTGQVRRESAARERPAPGPAAGATQPKEADTRVKDLEERLAERTADLQRVQAEYANYRKRVDRDRLAVREQALANVLSELLPVLDDIGRARQHGELTGGFKQVAEALESTLTKLGLVKYGEAGEPFDPRIHEALMHAYSDEVAETTCVQILQPGYTVGDRILRPARVMVAEPREEPSPAPQPAAEAVTEAAAEPATEVAGESREAAEDDRRR